MLRTIICIYAFHYKICFDVSIFFYVEIFISKITYLFFMMIIETILIYMKKNYLLTSV